MTGPAKFVTGILLAFAIAIAGARIAFELKSSPGAGPVQQPWATGTMEFRAWNGELWTTWIRDGRFELVPENSADWHRHSNTTIAFVDWDGEPYQAKIEGGEFLLAHHGEWHGDFERSPAIHYRDWHGAKKLRTVEQLNR